jgi:aspartyl-tRNA(Asn)/glutamyl-tRNA(Gln) amidotransferase subunit A
VANVFDLAHFQAEKARGVSAISLVEQAIERAERAAPLNALITQSFLSARLAATSGRSDHPLAGIPMAHKDLFCTRGVLTTCGSKMLANFVPPYSATIVEKLDAVGAIAIGKANMDEFAMGSANEHSYFGAVSNPWDLSRVPGGSSGGSAAFVAARVVPYATASDTGGSIRQPAAFCGVTGFKPSYGRVSRYGMVAYASSLDQAGVIAQSAADCAAVLQVMAGHDQRDGTSLNVPVPDYQKALAQSVSGLKIGLPRGIFSGAQSGLDSDVLAAVKEALIQLEQQGAVLVEIDLAHLDAALAAYYVIAPCEASSNLARFDGVRYGHRCENPKSLNDLYLRSRSEGFGAEVQKRILLGTYALSAGYFDAYYLRAQRVRRLIAQAYQAAFKQVDLIAMPTTPTTAFAKGQQQANPLSEVLADIFTVGVNLAGLPAVSIPAGFSAGMPIGLQLIAPNLAEETLFCAAHQFQLRTDFHRQTPPVLPNLAGAST